MHDIVIIGGGPAGMAAALYALRNGKSALVIERAGFGGQITHSPKVENIPGFEQISGNEFADKFLGQIMAQGAEVELENATEIVRGRDGGFTVRTEEGGAHDCRAVVIAVGVKHRMPGLPGEDGLVGSGISFCAVCDGDFYAGKTVAVAGGGNSALQEAILLSEKCSKVVILQDLPQLTGEKKLQEILEKRPNVEIETGVRLLGYEAEGGDFKGVKVSDAGGERTVPADGLFVAIGLIPENGPFSDWAELDARGYFASGEDCRTRTPGVFVAGDCRAKGVRQVATAAADGATAALAAISFINAQ